MFAIQLAINYCFIASLKTIKMFFALFFLPINQQTKYMLSVQLEKLLSN